MAVAPTVVYLLTPTSNHNAGGGGVHTRLVVYLLTPTSNHNHYHVSDPYEELYIFWLLHQTTTCESTVAIVLCCISFDSYIKPQPSAAQTFFAESCISFDSYIKPQQLFVLVFVLRVVYLLTPTSNHNCDTFLSNLLSVVYLLTPTSNHNYTHKHLQKCRVVYLLTPTSNHNPSHLMTKGANVVYLLTPTSNHNISTQE